MQVANIDIRTEARRRGIPLWRIADGLGVSIETLFRRLRHELTAAEKQKILDVITELERRMENE